MTTATNAAKFNDFFFFFFFFLDYGFYCLSGNTTFHNKILNFRFQFTHLSNIQISLKIHPNRYNKTTMLANDDHRVLNFNAGSQNIT
jgi:hypothetical protein